MKNSLSSSVTTYLVILITLVVLLPLTFAGQAFAQSSYTIDGIAERIPEPNSTGFPVDGKVTITFDNNMRTNTLTTSNIYLRKAGSSYNVSASISYTSSGRSVSLTPRSDLEYDSVYYVYLSDRLRDIENNSIPATQWRFTTYDKENTYITARSPEPNSYGTPLNGQITVDFSRSMDRATLTESNIQLRRAGTGIVPINVTTSNDTKKVTIRPQSSLDSLTSYTITFSNRVRDTDGRSLGEVRWSFTTEFSESAAFLSRYPEPDSSGSSSFPIDGAVAITFNDNILKSTLTSSNIFIVKAGNNQAVPTDIDYTNSNRTVRLIPRHPLEYDTIYQVHITNRIQNLAGFSITGNYHWGFATEPISLLNVSSYSPHANEGNVALDSPIVVEFTSNVIRNNFTKDSVYVRSVDTGVFVPTTLVYNNFTNVLNIKPQGSWEPGTTYRVYLTDSIRTGAGTVQPFSWSFTTRQRGSALGAGTTPTLVVNGQIITISDAPPYIKNGRAFIPFRPLFEALGAQVGYDQSNPAHPRVWADLGNQRVQLTVGETTAYRNNQLLIMDVGPEVIAGRTMIPVRFAAEALGMKVHYDSRLNSITVE